MNDEWVKVDSLLEVDDLAERIQEIEQEKEMWKSILDNNVIEYKFEIGEHEEKKVDQFCIGKVYTLELWVRDTYYQMAKEIVDEVKNAPTSNDAWELQNEVPIEEEEYEETERIVGKQEKVTSRNRRKEIKENLILLVIYMSILIIFILIILNTKYSGIMFASIITCMVIGENITKTLNKIIFGEKKINEYKEIQERIQNKQKREQKSQNRISIIICSVFMIVVVAIMFIVLLESLLSRPTKDINAIFTVILLFIAAMALLVGVTIVITKKKKEE